MLLPGAPSFPDERWPLATQHAGSPLTLAWPQVLILLLSPRPSVLTRLGDPFPAGCVLPQPLLQ